MLIIIITRSKSVADYSALGFAEVIGRDASSHTKFAKKNPARSQ